MCPRRPEVVPQLVRVPEPGGVRDPILPPRHEAVVVDGERILGLAKPPGLKHAADRGPFPVGARGLGVDVALLGESGGVWRQVLVLELFGDSELHGQSRRSGSTIRGFESRKGRVTDEPELGANDVSALDHGPVLGNVCESVLGDDPEGVDVDHDVAVEDGEVVSGKGGRKAKGQAWQSQQMGEVRSGGDDLEGVRHGDGCFGGGIGALPLGSQVFKGGIVTGAIDVVDAARLSGLGAVDVEPDSGAGG